MNEQVQCTWFALCGRQTAAVYEHPRLGPFLSCAPCAAIIGATLCVKPVNGEAKAKR